MLDVILFIASLLLVSVISYFVGKQDGELKRVKLARELVTVNSVRHNLNCLVGDLRHDVITFSQVAKKNKADALAYHTVKGQWTTDTPDILRNFPKKEYFRRIGYPEHKL